MTDRTVKIALIISLLLNVCLTVAAFVGGYFIMSEFSERSNLHQRTPLAQAARELDDADRAKLKQSMRAVALTAAPDFREAREARKQAVDATSAAKFDRSAIAADLEKARAAENRGRAKLEDGFLNYLQAQPQPTRAKLAKVLMGRANLRMGGPGRGGPFGGPPPGGPDGAPPPPPSPPSGSR